MELIKKHDTGAAVEDVQSKLVHLGFLDELQVTGVFDDPTQAALVAFCTSVGLTPRDAVDDAIWAALIDASFTLGDRTLYLRMPYFHGNDVRELQSALGALGFPCGSDDAIFGAYTELALRKFQMNMGLPSDGIAGAFTYQAIEHLRHSWVGKSTLQNRNMGFARAADVLERYALCLYGTKDFTRSVAARMSNLALATNPASKILSADSLLVAPDEHMLLVRIEVPEAVSASAAQSNAAAPEDDSPEDGSAAENFAQNPADTSVPEHTQINVAAPAPAGVDAPFVTFEDESTLPLRLESAISAAKNSQTHRITISLPQEQWEDAGQGRSAQHYAIALLDALCVALSNFEQA